MPTVRNTPQPNNKGRVKYARSPIVNISVTPDLIGLSAKRDSSHCMIAEAIKLAVPGARFVSVDLQTIRFTDPEKPYRYTYLTPRRAQLALVDFDQGREPEPFDVRLRGGTVTKSHSRRSPEQKEREAKARKASKPATENGPVVAKKRTILSPRHANSETSIPEINGGTTPPMGALASVTTARGRRRQFGLRSLER
jgi:hypothetical protein